MIHVIATIETQPGRRGAVLEQYARVVPLVLREEGCEAYTPAVDVRTNVGAQGEVRENVVTVVETWASLEALERHLIAPHMIEFRAAVKDAIRSVELQIVAPAP